MRSRTLLFAGLGAVAVAAGLGVADDRSTLAKADAHLKDTVGRYNADKKFTATFSMDWSSVKDRKQAERWAENCGELVQGFTMPGTVCASFHQSGSAPIPACLDQVHKRVKAVKCVAQESVSDEGKRRVELKGTTLVFHMIESNLNRDPATRLLKPLFPEVAPIIYAHDIKVIGEDIYNKGRTMPVTIDIPSFAATKHSANEAWERCDRTTGVVQRLATVECGFDMCKGDAKKADDFMKGVTKLKCVWTDKETAPVKQGDTLVLSLGEWSYVERERGFTAFWALRKQLKMRGCGDGFIEMTGRSRDPSSDKNPIWQACCPKDRAGKCMKAETMGTPRKLCMTDYGFRHMNPAGHPQCHIHQGVGYSEKQYKEAR